jgi:hypothetical protein
MSEQEQQELAQLKERWPIVSSNDYARMDTEERTLYLHFLDLLAMEYHLNNPDKE